MGSSEQTLLQILVLQFIRCYLPTEETEIETLTAETEQFNHEKQSVLAW